MSSSLFFCSPKIAQPYPQVFLVNGSIICRGLNFWCHFDIIGSIICSGLHFWRHMHVQYNKIHFKFGQQELVMVTVTVTNNVEGFLWDAIKRWSCIYLHCKFLGWEHLLGSSMRVWHHILAIISEKNVLQHNHFRTLIHLVLKTS